MDELRKLLQIELVMKYLQQGRTEYLNGREWLFEWHTYDNRFKGYQWGLIDFGHGAKEVAKIRCVPEVGFNLLYKGGRKIGYYNEVGEEREQPVTKDYVQKKRDMSKAWFMNTSDRQADIIFNPTKEVSFINSSKHDKKKKKRKKKNKLTKTKK